jgi:hypothetical protein
MRSKLHCKSTYWQVIFVKYILQLSQNSQVLVSLFHCIVPIVLPRLNSKATALLYWFDWQKALAPCWRDLGLSPFSPFITTSTGILFPSVGLSKTSTSLLAIRPQLLLFPIFSSLWELAGRLESRIEILRPRAKKIAKIHFIPVEQCKLLVICLNSKNKPSRSPCRWEKVTDFCKGL